MPKPAAARQALHAAAAALIESGYQIGERETCQRCRAPRTAHAHPRLGPPHTGTCPTGRTHYVRDRAEALADRVLAAADTNPVHDLVLYQERGKVPRKGLHASDAGACPRSIWYRIHPPADYVPLPRVNERAALGTMWHRAYVEARKALYDWRDYEQPVILPGLAEEPSTFDEYDSLTATLSDGKTAGEWMREQVEFEPYSKHVKQLLAYGYALNAAGRPVVRLRLEYVVLQTGEVITHTFGYDHGAAVAVIGELRALAAALDTGAELPRGPEYEGPTANGLCRSYCEARDHCWNTTAAASAVPPRSPESYTIVGPNPRANPAVTAWAIERHRQAEAERKRAEQAAKAAKALLHGVPDGVYGRYAFRDASRRPVNTVGWQSRLAAAFTAWTQTPPQERDPHLENVLAAIPVGRRSERRYAIAPAPKPVPAEGGEGGAAPTAPEAAP